MSRRTIGVLAVVFVALAIAATAPMWRSGGGGGNDDGAVRARDDLGLHRVTSNATERITIERTGQKKKVFTRADGEWQLNGKPAKADLVKALFDGFAKARVGELVSHNPDNYTNLGADTKTGSIVKVTLDDREVTYIVGNQADAAETFYVRESDAKNVYRATGKLATEIWKDAVEYKVSPPKH